MSLILSLMDTMVSLVVKVLWKLISLICFRVYLEVNVHKNPTCFSRWSVRNKATTTTKTENYDDYKLDYSKVRIDDSHIRRIDSQYCNVEVTIKNNNKVSFNYIKLNVYFLDKYGDIIKSDWFNDSSCVKGGATQTIIGRYVERPKEYSSYKLEIADVR